jgi:hypothetical protein
LDKQVAHAECEKQLRQQLADAVAALEQVCRAFVDMDHKVTVHWPDPVAYPHDHKRASRVWDDMCSAYDKAKETLARLRGKDGV